MVSGLLLLAAGANAAPTLVSTVPPNLAPDVSPTTSIVFTFSEPMNPDSSVTTVMLMDAQNPFQQLAFSLSWSSGNAVLTCTPLAPLPAGHMIVWMVDGENPAGDPLDTANGMFTVGSGGTSTGCDLSALLLSFTVSKGWAYDQASAGAPVHNTNTPYCFLGCMTLPCPRNATNVSLRVPNTGAQPNMALTTIPGHLTHLDCSYLDPALLDAAYPSGNYTFTIQATSSNQAVTVNFPASLTQPPAPHLTNYAAAQAINPRLPFVLAWDPFVGGTTADLIYVEIYGTQFKTGQIGEPNGLNGTATAVVIPANTLAPNQSYLGCVSFYHYQLVTNGNSHISLAYRCSTTEFNLQTISGTGGSLLITNACWLTGKTFSFEVPCSVGQALVAEWSSNLLPGQWQTLSQTSSPAQRVRFTDLRAATNAHLFYRVRTSP